MSYCTQADYENRYTAEELIQLTDHNGVLNAVDTAVLNAAIADADAVIDSYVGVLYSLPLSPVPAVLERIGCVLTRYFLFTHARISASSDDYDNAIRWLEQVAAGKASIGVDSGGNAPSISSDSAQVESAGNMFARDAY